MAVDGLHEAKWTAEKVALKMLDVAEIKSRKIIFILIQALLIY